MPLFLKRLLGALVLAVVLAVQTLPVPAFAADSAAALADLKFQAVALKQVAAKGIITNGQRDQGISALVTEAKTFDPSIAGEADLMAVRTDAKTVVERRGDGILDFLNSGRVIAGIVGVISVLALAGLFIRQLAGVPAIVYEGILYTVSLGLIVAGIRVADWGHYLAFIGCLGLGGAISLSGALRKVEPNPTAFSAMLALLWAPVAVWYGSTLIGFIVAMALLSALGFSAAATPLCYMVGFRDEDSVGPGPPRRLPAARRLRRLQDRWSHGSGTRRLREGRVVDGLLRRLSRLADPLQPLVSARRRVLRRHAGGGIRRRPRRPRAGCDVRNCRTPADRRHVLCPVADRKDG